MKHLKNKQESFTLPEREVEERWLLEMHENWNHGRKATEEPQKKTATAKIRMGE